MSFEVEITPAAEAEYQAAYDWLAEQTDQHAPLWFNVLRDALLNFGENPARCPRSNPNGDMRYLLFGDKRHAYKIHFKIRGNTVVVYSIRHAARN